MAFNLEDYEPVASRLDRFLKAHPDARVITDLVHYMADIEVNNNYVELLGQWGMLIMSFYFGGRTLEKIIDMKGKANATNK